MCWSRPKARMPLARTEREREVWTVTAVAAGLKLPSLNSKCFPARSNFSTTTTSERRTLQQPHGGPRFSTPKVARKLARARATATRRVQTSSVSMDGGRDDAGLSMFRRNVMRGLSDDQRSTRRCMEQWSAVVRKRPVLLPSPITPSLRSRSPPSLSARFSRCRLALALNLIRSLKNA